MFFPSSNLSPGASPGRLPPGLDPSRPVAATAHALGAAEAAAGGAAQEAEVHGGRKARRPGKSELGLEEDEGFWSVNEKGN